MSVKQPSGRHAAGALHRIVIGVVLVVLLLPILSTLLYALSSEWGASVLPQGLTLEWFATLWTDPRFLLAFGRSLALCFGTLILSVAVILPVIFLIECSCPRLSGLMNMLIMLPFAIPPVVSSVGLLQLYAQEPLPLVGTPWILAGAYFTIVLPFIYRAMVNNMRAINMPQLMEAASLRGASPFRTMIRVILPNMRKGIQSAVFVSFSFLLGEFVFTNLLAGTRFETVQIYLFNLRGRSGHYTSAIVISYFAFILLFTWLASRLGGKKGS